MGFSYLSCSFLSLFGLWFDWLLSVVLLLLAHVSLDILYNGGDFVGGAFHSFVDFVSYLLAHAVYPVCSFHVCLVALSIASAVCLDKSRSGLIHLITDRAISSAFWVAVSCSRRVATAHIPLG